MSVRRHALAHGAVELRKGIRAQARLGVRRDIRAVDGAERRFQFQAAGHGGAVRAGVASHAVAEPGDVFAALDQLGRGRGHGGRRGGRGPGAGAEAQHAQQHCRQPGSDRKGRNGRAARTAVQDGNGVHGDPLLLRASLRNRHHGEHWEFLSIN